MRFDPDTHTVHAAGRTSQADPAGTVIADHWLADEPRWTGDPDYGHRERRCRVRFESGWSASIIWGSGTYSSNHDAWRKGDPFAEEPSHVEVGVVDHTGELRMRRHDDGDLEWHDLESYLDDDDLAALLDRLATLPTDYDYGVRPPTIDELEQTARDAGIVIDPTLRRSF
jgi:hypothetical protein